MILFINRLQNSALPGKPLKVIYPELLLGIEQSVLLRGREGNAKYAVNSSTRQHKCRFLDVALNLERQGSGPTTWGGSLQIFIVTLVTKENSQHLVDQRHVHCSLTYPQFPAYSRHSINEPMMFVGKRIQLKQQVHVRFSKTDSIIACVALLQQKNLSVDCILTGEHYFSSVQSLSRVRLFAAP